MKMPIKLNKSYWSGAITKLLPSAEDPRILLDGNIFGDGFSKAISVFKFGTTYKTTKRLRFPATISALSSLEFDSPPTVLDIGASDGTASLLAIDSIGYGKYYVTDLNNEVYCERRGNKCYFYDSRDNCILIVTKRFLIYADYEDSFFPFYRLANYLFSKSRITSNARTTVDLTNPEVRNVEGNIVITKYDMFDKWTNEKVDLIIAANILNRVYFSDSQIEKAIINIVFALNDGGIFVVVDSREREKSTIFRVVAKRISAERDINGGTDIKGLVLKTCME